MSLKRHSKAQPEEFECNPNSMEAAKKIVTMYAAGKQQSAVMTLLYRAQKQTNNWIALDDTNYIGTYLEQK